MELRGNNVFQWIYGNLRQQKICHLISHGRSLCCNTNAFYMQIHIYNGFFATLLNCLGEDIRMTWLLLRLLFFCHRRLKLNEWLTTKFFIYFNLYLWHAMFTLYCCRLVLRDKFTKTKLLSCFFILEGIWL